MATLYIDRDGSGNISAIYARQQHDGQESIDSSNAAAVAFEVSQNSPSSGVSILNRISALEASVAAIQAVPAVASGLAK